MPLIIALFINLEILFITHIFFIPSKSEILLLIELQVDQKKNNNIGRS